MVRDRSFSSIMLDIIVHTTLIILLVITLFPVLHVAAVSLSSSKAIDRGLVSIFPVDFSLEAYRILWKSGRVPKSFVNSVIYTSVGTVVNMLVTMLMAYPLSKKKLPLRRFYTTLIVFTMFFSGGLIPTFLVVKGLGLYNTMWALILPGAISTMNLIIMRTFFQSIPMELEESAFLDGANDIVVFYRIILPLSKASIATIAMFYAVGHWNSWFNALVYLKDSEKYPMQLILRDIIIQSQMSRELAEQGSTEAYELINTVSVEGIKYATLFFSIIPMLIIYPFVQKYFVKGVMIGSLKG
mgnify:FL=1